MRRKLIFFVVAAGTAVFGGTAFAHHPFSSYLDHKQITIEGNVTECVYREPHSFVQITSRDARGNDHRWIVEWRGAADLARSGVTPTTLRPGQRIIVTGNPGRVAAEFRVRVQTLVRPEDGWRWSRGAE